MASASVKFGGIFPFDCKGAITSVAPRWKRWKKSLEYYILAQGITHSAQKKGLLLHCAGTEVQELFETLQDIGRLPADAGEDNADEYQKALRTLDAQLSAQLNKQYERHVFRKVKQIRRKERRSINLLLDYDAERKIVIGITQMSRFVIRSSTNADQPTCGGNY